MRLPSPVSKNESSGAPSFWNQTPLAAAGSPGPDPKTARPRTSARVAVSREGFGGSPNSSRRTRSIAMTLWVSKGQGQL